MCHVLFIHLSADGQSPPVDLLSNKLTKGHSQGQIQDSDPGLVPQLMRIVTETDLSFHIAEKRCDAPARPTQSVGTLGMWGAGSLRRKEKPEPAWGDLGEERLEVEGSCGKGAGRGGGLPTEGETVSLTVHVLCCNREMTEHSHAGLFGG